MAASFEQYFAFLRELGEVFEKLTALTREKTEAVRQGDLGAVNDCMKREQVISLSLRSMDIKREKMLSELGLKGVPLSGLAAHCPAELRLEARHAEEQLRSKLAIYRSAAEVSRTTLEVSLHEIDKMIADEGKGEGPADMGTVADIRA